MKTPQPPASPPTSTTPRPRHGLPRASRSTRACTTRWPSCCPTRPCGSPAATRRAAPTKNTWRCTHPPTSTPPTAPPTRYPLTAAAPPNGFIAPPGYYMLFILNQAGVPSVARFIHLTSTPTDQPPKGAITSPAGTVTIISGQSVNFAATATDPDNAVTGYSWVFPDGSPDGSSAQNPGPVTFTEVGTHIVSMTAIDSQGVNDPSPPTRTIIVQPAPLQVQISQPAAGATVSGKKVSVTVASSGTAPGTNTFTYSVDGTVEGSKTTSATSVTFSWNTTRLSHGSHVLSATVRDAGG